MKQVFPYLPASVIFLTALILYLLKSQEEARLEREWKNRAGGGAAAATAPGPGGADGGATAETKETVRKLLTPGEVEAYMDLWAERVRQEEQRMVDAGEMDYSWQKMEAKLKPFAAQLRDLNVQDLLAICLTKPPDKTVDFVEKKERSTVSEIRDWMVEKAYVELLRRDPFLALTLPQNQPGWISDTHCAKVLGKCAAKDPDRAWQVVQEKYGGAGAPSRIIRELVKGVSRHDAAMRLQFAAKWGLLDKVAGLWADTASRSAAGQDAWLSAVRKVSPPNPDELLVSFAGEVEASEGFAGVQRVMDRLAAPGTLLYDRILERAASHDLEEAAGPKADWILSKVSAPNAPAVAGTLMKHWTEADPLSASAWLDAVPKSAPWRQAAIMAFVKVIEAYDPEAAAQWRLAGEAK